MSLVDVSEQKAPPRIIETPLTVQIGSTVTVLFKGEEYPEVYAIINTTESSLNLSRHQTITHKSPLAKALLGKRVGDTVNYNAPGGTQEVEILKITFPTEP